MPPLTWEEFCARMPPFSIALDGFVKAGPKFQHTREGGPRINFNHHEGVDRLATRATCSQTLMAVRLGLFDTFCDQSGAPQCEVYANDCDQDVCASVFILRHRSLAERVISPNLNRLAHMEDMLDTTGGAYPFPKDMPILQKLAWVFRPYTEFRLSGEINSRDSARFVQVVDEVENNIALYLEDKGGSVPLDVRYNRIGGGRIWAMVREEGAQARTGMFADNIHAFVSVSDRADGRFNYTVGRMSGFIPFDVAGILAELSRRDGGGEPWGGGNTIGGSPRAGGSGLKPKEVEEIINQHLGEK